MYRSLHLLEVRALLRKRRRTLSLNLDLTNYRCRPNYTSSLIYRLNSDVTRFRDPQHFLYKFIFQCFYSFFLLCLWWILHFYNSATAGHIKTSISRNLVLLPMLILLFYIFIVFAIVFVFQLLVNCKLHVCCRHYTAMALAYCRPLIIVALGVVFAVKTAGKLQTEVSFIVLLYICSCRYMKSFSDSRNLLTVFLYCSDNFPMIVRSIKLHLSFATMFKTSFSFINCTDWLYLLLKQMLQKRSFHMQHILKATWCCRWRQQEHLFGDMQHRRLLVKQFMSAWQALWLSWPTQLLLCLVIICIPLNIVVKTERISEPSSK